jgi:O-antigen/teichoic acid export membrane protein
VGAAGTALLLTLAASLLVPGAAGLPVALVAPAAAATVLVAGADGILRARGEFRKPVLIVVASRVAAFAGVPTAALTHSAAWTCAAISLGTVLGTVGAARTLAGFRHDDARGETAGFVRATIPLGLSQLFVVLGTRVDTLLAGALSGLVAAATFEGAWRIYQIGQYAIGGFATAAAPFIADALGAGRHADLVVLLRRLMIRLVLGGFVVGAAIYFGRHLLARLLAGSLAAPVAGALPAVALLSPLTIAGLLALYTLIAQEGQRRGVLAAYALGAAVNVGAAAALAPGHGGAGVMLGCAAGLTTTNLILLARLAALARRLRGRAEVGAVAAKALPDRPP